MHVCLKVTLQTWNIRHPCILLLSNRVYWLLVRPALQMLLTCDLYADVICGQGKVKMELASEHFDRWIVIGLTRLQARTQRQQVIIILFCLVLLKKMACGLEAFPIVHLSVVLMIHSLHGRSGYLPERNSFIQCVSDGNLQNLFWLVTTFAT